MGFEDFNQALVLGAILFNSLHLMPAGAKRPRGRGEQAVDSRAALLAGVDQFLA